MLKNRKIFLDISKELKKISSQKCYSLKNKIKKSTFSQKGITRVEVAKVLWYSKLTLIGSQLGTISVFETMLTILFDRCQLTNRSPPNK